MIYWVKNWHVLMTKKTNMSDKDLLVIIKRPNL